MNAAAVPCSVPMASSPDTECLGLPPGHLPARPFTAGLKQTACRDARGCTAPAPTACVPNGPECCPHTAGQDGAVRTRGLSHSAARLGHSWVFAGLWVGLTPPLCGPLATPVLQGPARSPWVSTPRSLCAGGAPSTLLPAAPLPVLRPVRRRSPRRCGDAGRGAESPPRHARLRRAEPGPFQPRASPAHAGSCRGTELVTCTRAHTCAHSHTPTHTRHHVTRAPHAYACAHTTQRSLTRAHPLCTAHAHAPPCTPLEPPRLPP